MSSTLRLEHGVRAPGHARHWIVQRCREWQCDDLADPAALLLTELVTNVFLHARTDCLIDAVFNYPVLAVTVSDGGDQELMVRLPSDTAEEGRGLAIVEALADSWGIQHVDGTKSVWFQLSSANGARSADA
jgi:anti-sigma regulatory factor (Ser/Thr protein kinase)